NSASSQLSDITELSEIELEASVLQEIEALEKLIGGGSGGGSMNLKQEQEKEQSLSALQRALIALKDARSKLEKYETQSK
uniref:CurK, CurL fusion protein n=1 Tax=Moorena producens 3L TaxID=489825 RepID=UPI0003E5C67A|nr:Chain A, CurK, CurL fusion protein [Moorena producens 3L]4MYZ_B Chain B, CurK, CurL fusion protein [Moorena producens 3L]4MYZ_C Chain C, CurK, CurL fusion protein [Moorena producens 3L]